MECSSCAPPSIRKDKPHTFLMHQMSQCPGCKKDIEARLVSRNSQAVLLKFCSECGSTEETIAQDAQKYLMHILARARNHEGSDEKFFKTTTSTCPTCMDLLVVDVVVRNSKVYFKKNCPHCGPSEALVAEDANYYIGAYEYARAGTEPLKFSNEVKHGCPTDCGTCNDHEQHTCLPIVEITDHCNLECPICIVNNQYANHISNEDFKSVIDTLITNEGHLESIALSGGEPTSHPRLMELIDIATREEIGRIVVITNGLRLARDPNFARQLKDKGCYVGLQLDGFTAEAHKIIRGRDLCKEKEAALAILKELDIPTQMIFVATRGVNEDQIGQAVKLFMDYDNIVSLNFQPASFTGYGGGKFAHDPMDRLTISGVLKAVEAQTDSLKMSDFAPLPCSHPQCVSLTYLLRLNDGSYVPFGRFIDFKKHGGMLRSSATLGASPEMQQTFQDVINDVFSRQDEIERGPEILAALRRSVDVMFPGRALTPKEAVRIGERQAKSIFLHHYMDRHDFDLERLRKCCHHYPQTDGRIMPACGFNLFHRGAAKGPHTPRASWGKGPFTKGDHVQK